jgi:hypothetical protein
MTNQTRTAGELLAADMLRINIEASIRCGKAGSPQLMAYHAGACAASWATFRLLDALHAAAPEIADRIAAELIDALEDGDYLEGVGEHAESLGVDVDELVDRVRAGLESA